MTKTLMKMLHLKKSEKEENHNVHEQKKIYA
jgi:hypothetical protein